MSELPISDPQAKEYVGDIREDVDKILGDVGRVRIQSRRDGYIQAVMMTLRSQFMHVALEADLMATATRAVKIADAVMAAADKETVKP